MTNQNIWIHLYTPWRSPNRHADRRTALTFLELLSESKRGPFQFIKFLLHPQVPEDPIPLHWCRHRFDPECQSGNAVWCSLAGADAGTIGDTRSSEPFKAWHCLISLQWLSHCPFLRWVLRSIYYSRILQCHLCMKSDSNLQLNGETVRPEKVLRNKTNCSI